MTRALRLPMLSVFVSTLLILTASNLPAQPPTRGSITAWGSEAWWQVPEEGTWLIADVPAGRNFVKCAGGYWRYAALRADGTLAAWGQNNILQVPAGNDFIDVCVAQWGAAALRQDGSVIQWGGNTVFPEEIPPGPFVAVAAGADFLVGLRADGFLWTADGHNDIPNPTVPAGNDFVAISACWYHAAALRADGSIEAWGKIYDQPNNVWVEPTPPAGNGFVAVSTALSFGVALRADGSLVSWGLPGYYGQLNVPAGNDFVAVQTSGEGGVALRNDGSLVTWGGAPPPPGGNDFVALGSTWGYGPPLAIKAVPVAHAGPDQTVHCTGPDGAIVTLDGSASYDPDGHDDLDYEWSVAEGSGVVLEHPDQAVTDGIFPIGVHEVTLTVYDIDESGVRKAGVDCDSVTVIVVDDDPPVARVTTDVGSLWPANGAMIPVTIFVEASDACTAPANLRTYCIVTSSQPDVTNGAGNRTGDVNGVDGYTAPVEITLTNAGNGLYGATIYLRAERDASASTGRTYSIDVSVEDGAANVGHASSTTVVVPHDGRGR